MSDALDILLLEDNPADAELVERLLRRSGLHFTLRRVSSEASFRREVVTGAYHVILADYHLPTFDGMSALQMTKQLAPGLPFIFVSGSIGEDKAIRALREGAVDYVFKDRPQRLPTAIERALEEKRVADASQRLQESLLRSEQRFHYAAQATRDVIWDWGFERNALWISDSVALWGYQLDDPEVDLAWWRERVHPDDRERIFASLDEAIHSNADRWSGEYRFRKADGTYSYVFDRGVIVRQADGRRERMIGAMQDITERVQSELTILELSRTNALVLDYASEGIMALDDRGRLVFGNPASLRMLQWEKDAIGRNFDAHRALHDCDDTNACSITAALTAGRASHSEDVFRESTGSPLAVEASISPIFEGDLITGCVVVFQDITKRKRLERKLEQANRISGLGQIAATIAHEFNGVLMGIQPFAELIRRQASDNARVIQHATQILATLARGRRMTQDILRTTQLGDAALQAVDLAAQLHNMEPELSGLVGERINVTVITPQESLFATCDPHQLHQVIANLAVNARDAMPDGGTLTIYLEPVRDGRPLARITVADTGGGIAPDVLPHIFEPLYTTKRTGTGLGLAVAQQLVERNRGSLSVDSAVGVGTTFEILLPQTDAPQVRSDPGGGERWVTNAVAHAGSARGARRGSGSR